jgi:hypothetical protein
LFNDTIFQVLTLTCHNSEWSCYAFDFNRCVVSIMDPNIRHPVEKTKIDQHTESTGRLLTHVVFCMRMLTGNTRLGSSIWVPKLLIGSGRRTHSTYVFTSHYGGPRTLMLGHVLTFLYDKHLFSRTTSGIEAVNCMRWYNGNNVCTPPKDVSIHRIH